MSLETMKVFFSLLALAANVGTILIVIAALTPASSSLRTTVFGVLRGSELWLAAIVASTAMLGSLYLSEVAHLIPCTLCWYQRIAMYPLAVVLLIAAFRKDHGIRIYAATLAVIGGGISVYHRLLQDFPILDGGSCSVGVPCTAAYFRVFDFITIPYMALSAFLFVLALLWVDRVNSAATAPSFDNTDSITEPA